MPKGVYKRNPEMKTGKYIRTKGMKTGKYERTIEMIKNYSKAKKGKPILKTQGKKSPHWIDGRSKNKEYRSWLKNKRNRMPKIGSHTFGEWEILKAQYDWTCPSCKKKESEIKLTEDHIVPLSKGGSDNIENIQPLCRHCNSLKHTKIIKYDR